MSVPTGPLSAASRNGVVSEAQVAASLGPWEPQLSSQQTFAVSCFANSWLHFYILRDSFSGTHLDSVAYKTQEWTPKNLDSADPGGPRPGLGRAVVAGTQL